MRQYTTTEQTAKLIELGFEKPTGISKCNVGTGTWGYRPLCEPHYAYSIGELIEILPLTIKLYYDLCILTTTQGWWVLYGMIGDGDMWSVEYEVYRSELIDAIFALIVILKEEEVI